MNVKDLSRELSRKRIACFLVTSCSNLGCLGISGKGGRLLTLVVLNAAAQVGANKYVAA